MSKTYFASDGSYGDASDIVILDTSEWTEAEWDEIDGMTDSELYQFALELQYAAIMADDPNERDEK